MQRLSTFKIIGALAFNLFVIGGIIGVASCGEDNTPTFSTDMAKNACSHCASGTQCCNNACVNTQVDIKNCGACNKVCAAGQACVSGMCMTGGGSCTNCTKTCCGTQCVDTKTDTSNCGFCGKSCGAGQACVNGACMTSGGCTGCTKTCCNQTCVDTDSDNNNCGGCGLACTGSQTCQGGNCKGTSNSDGGTTNCMCTKQCQLGACLAGCCPEDIFTCQIKPECLLGG